LKIFADTFVGARRCMHHKMKWPLELLPAAVPGKNNGLVMNPSPGVMQT
jgi:hypothetical protein